MLKSSGYILSHIESIIIDDSTVVVTVFVSVSYVSVIDFGIMLLMVFGIITTTPRITIARITNLIKVVLPVLKV